MLIEKELHRALSYNDTNDFYKFSNVRYAQPPTGELRFRAPRPPLRDRTTIHNGSETRICPQGVPEWQRKAFGPISKYASGAPFALENWEKDIATMEPPNIDFYSNNTEDCLFLDVYVPRKVLEKKKKHHKGFKGVPVLAWVGSCWLHSFSH